MKSIRRRFGAWTVDAYLDFTCLMVGVNWACNIGSRVYGLYLHIGPLIIGAYHE